MDQDSELMADVLALESLGEPTVGELTAYARDAAALSPETRESVERYLLASPAHRDRFRTLAPADWTLIGSCLCSLLGRVSIIYILFIGSMQVACGSTTHSQCSSHRIAGFQNETKA